MKKIIKYFEKNLDKESYDFLMELVKSGKYNWEDIKGTIDIEEGQIVWQGNVYISGTKVKKIKAKRIEGGIYAEGVQNLKEIETEEIWGHLDIEWTNIDLLLKIIEKVRNGKLKIKGRIYFGGEYFKS